MRAPPGGGRRSAKGTGRLGFPGQAAGRLDRDERWSHRARRVTGRPAAGCGRERPAWRVSQQCRSPWATLRSFCRGTRPDACRSMVDPSPRWVLTLSRARHGEWSVRNPGSGCEFPWDPNGPARVSRTTRALQQKCRQGPKWTGAGADVDTGGVDVKGVTERAAMNEKSESVFSDPFCLATPL